MHSSSSTSHPSSLKTSAAPRSIRFYTLNSIASSRKWSKCQRCQSEMPLPFMAAFFSEIRNSNQSAVCQKLLSLVEEMFLLWESSPLTYKSSSLTCKRVRSDLAAEQQQPVNDCKKKETNTLLPKVSPSWRCFARLKTTSLYFPTASLSLSAFWL